MVNAMEKFLTKETLIIVAIVIYTLVQTNYFATKLDLANLKIEVLEMQSQLKNQILVETNKKFDEINKKLDKLVVQ